MAIWKAQDLAKYLNVSVAWVRKRRHEIPRCPGIGRFRVNTETPEFQEWLRSKIGNYIDITKQDQ